MNLKDGLLNGRIIYGEISDYSAIFPLYQNLVRYFSKEGQMSPELILYSSYNKLVESKYLVDVETKETKAYILLDLHLLDFLGEFTESFIEEKYYVELTRCLSYHVLAESFFTKGKYHEALNCSYRYLTSKGLIRFTEERNTQMARYLLVQEKFILCHELSHWFLFRCNADKEKLLQNKKELWSDYLHQLIKKRKEKVDINGVKLLSDMKNHIHSQDKIVEECTCDTFAAEFLMEYADGINEFTRVDILKGAFLAIQNMQLLSFANQYTDAVLDFAESSQKLSFEMTLRMFIYRFHLGNYLSQYYKEDVDTFEREILSCAEQYSKHITAVFNTLLEQLQTDFIWLRNLPAVSFLDDSWEVINLFIKDLLYED